MRYNPVKIFRKWYNRVTGITRVKTPVILQMESLECGAAALAIVLAHFGKYVPLEKLRVDCGVSRNGSNAANMAKAARNYGLEVLAYKKEPEQLKKLTFPIIVFWNFYHFLVVDGFGKNKFYLNDPATGPRVVDEKTFDDSFTGVVLTFKPGPDFQPGGIRSSFVPFLFKWFKGYKKSLLFLFFVGLALIIPGLIISIFTKIFVDQILIKQSESWIIPLLAGMVITGLLRTLLLWLQQHSLIRFELSLSLKNSATFLWRILHLPMSFHTQRTAGDLAMRVNLNDQIAMNLSGQLGNTFLNLITIIFYAVLMFYYSIPLTLLAIGISLLNLLALKYISRKRVDSNQRLLQDDSRLFGFSTSGLQMIESLKATASESDFFGRWAGYHTKLLNIQQKTAVLTQTLQVIPVFLTLLSTIIILFLGSGFIMDGVMTVGTFVAFQSLMASFNQPIVSLVNLGSAIQDVQGGMKRLEDIYNYPAEVSDLNQNNENSIDKAVKLQGFVELKNITFGYSPMEEPLIKDFSIKLDPGSRVAIVGKTGCGKSTIANLVSGLYEPTQGEILFDGMPKKKISGETLNNSIAMVDQNLFLFEGTVKENINFWDQTISEKDMIQAAKDACIHDDITSRPGAYDSPVYENAKNFSGGQRQRLEIARALAIKPSILILDEATSALDAKTEHLVDINIRKTGCTCLIVAHRLSTIRDCDEIIVMDNGKIVQRGTHLELISQEGLYNQLIKE
jgi:NHLM bacteriocin system ABC transporter peptidase/ATP-binding protein